jgi:hypothetical protein
VKLISYHTGSNPVLTTKIKVMEKETYQMVNYDGDSYDSKVPVELVDAFLKMKQVLEQMSNGKYYCTPNMYYVDELEGVSVGIVEVNDDGTHIKTPFSLIIK